MPTSTSSFEPFRWLTRTFLVESRACTPRRSLTSLLLHPAQVPISHRKEPIVFCSCADQQEIRTPGSRPAGRPVAGLRRRGVALVVSATLASLGSVMASEACVEVKSGNVRLGQSIRLIYEDPTLEDVVAKAIEHWARCPNYGASFPTFVEDGQATRTIRVQSIRASGQLACGTFKGDEIRLYAWALPREGGPFINCGPPDQILAHELGHVLGLRDAPGAPSCSDAIMAAVTPNLDRQVSVEECQAAGYQWLTAGEVLRYSDVVQARGE